MTKFRLRLWPRSLAGRTVLIVVLGLALVQAAGLTIHALDRIDLQRMADARDLAGRVMSLYRVVVEQPADERDQVVAALRLPPDVAARIDALPPGPSPDILPMPAAQRMLRVGMMMTPLRPDMRPRDIRLFWDTQTRRMLVSMRLPDDRWLSVSEVANPPRPWHSPGFLWAFLLMTVAATALIVWAVRRMTAPVMLLAAAAERLGRDVNAPPMEEGGPLEIATAAAAFNTMAARIRRFVQDRTFLLTAIGHDLRTPITRLKLRAEFIDDDELRRKFLADLDELEGMVSATLAFGRDLSSTEPVIALDLPALARTVLDEAADARPEHADRLAYEGPDHLTLHARPVALKRALANLVGNALTYAGDAIVRVRPPEAGMLRIEVEDTGPGIPAEDLARVFEPFQRLERSRNRETGGTGLGLPIVRNIMRAHGGDVGLANRPNGGLVATISLPC